MRSVICRPRTLCAVLLLSLTSSAAWAEGPTPAAPSAKPAAAPVVPSAAATPAAAVAPVPAGGATPDLHVSPVKANEPATTIGPLPVQPAAAADFEDPQAAIPGVSAMDTEPESLGGTLARTLLVLGVVVGLIYLTLNYGLRRMMGVRGAPMGRSQLVQVLERIPLDPKRAMFVVRAGGEYLLVGGGEDGLSLITRLDGPSVQAVLDAKKVAPSMSPFLQKLLIQRRSPEPQPPSAEAQGESKKV